MRDNELKCYALKVEVMMLKDVRKDMERITDDITKDPHFVGVYVDPEDSASYLLFDDAEARGEAYTRINKGAKRVEDIIVSIIPEVAYVDKKYLRRS